MKIYQTDVAGMIGFLKAKKVCRSSIKSHEDCYDRFRTFLQEQKLNWCNDAVDLWLVELKDSVNTSQYCVWAQYMWQLQEFSESGTVSDSHLHLIWSSYDRLGCIPLRAELDDFLSAYTDHYTEKCLRLTRNCLGEVLMYFVDRGRNKTEDITYNDIISYYNWSNHFSRKRRAICLGHLTRFLSFMSEKGKCPAGYSLYLNDHYAPYVGNISAFSNEHKTTILALAEDSLDFSSYEIIEAINGFLDRLKECDYSYTVLKCSRQTLSTMYLFLDINGLGYLPEIADIWFSEIIQVLPRNWKMWRRALSLFEEYTKSADIMPQKRFVYTPGVFDSLPEWCMEAIEGFSKQLRRSFHEPMTLRNYSYACARLCRFLLKKGCKQFDELTPELLDQFCKTDEHSTFVGKSTCLSIIRQFVCFLEEHGYVNNSMMHICIDAGTASSEKVIDILSPEEIEMIRNYRDHHYDPIALRSIAIVMIGLQMGFRESDVINLRFTSINWKQQTITILQYKTKASLSLPMPVSVGNAIYTYIKDGRPAVDSPYVFVRHKAPYGKLTGKICSNSLRRMIPGRNRPYGFHVTRRTFATHLLQKGNGSQRVMDALGHRDPTSVMKYLAMDETHMRMCPLTQEDFRIAAWGGETNV